MKRRRAMELRDGNGAMSATRSRQCFCSTNTTDEWQLRYPISGIIDAYWCQFARPLATEHREYPCHHCKHCKRPGNRWVLRTG